MIGQNTLELSLGYPCLLAKYYPCDLTFSFSYTLLNHDRKIEKKSFTVRLKITFLYHCDHPDHLYLKDKIFKNLINQK